MHVDVVERTRPDGFDNIVGSRQGTCFLAKIVLRTSVNECCAGSLEKDIP